MDHSSVVLIDLLQGLLKFEPSELLKASEALSRARALTILDIELIHKQVQVSVWRLWRGGSHEVICFWLKFWYSRIWKHIFLLDFHYAAGKHPMHEQG